MSPWRSPLWDLNCEAFMSQRRIEEIGENAPGCGEWEKVER